MQRKAHFAGKRAGKAGPILVAFLVSLAIFSFIQPQRRRSLNREEKCYKFFNVIDGNSYDS